MIVDKMERDSEFTGLYETHHIEQQLEFIESWTFSKVVETVFHLKRDLSAQWKS